eukprot:683274-Amphidinium_carterae.1
MGRFTGHQPTHPSPVLCTSSLMIVACSDCCNGIAIAACTHLFTHSFVCAQQCFRPPAPRPKAPLLQVVEASVDAWESWLLLDTLQSSLPGQLHT